MVVISVMGGDEDLGDKLGVHNIMQHPQSLKFRSATPQHQVNVASQQKRKDLRLILPRPQAKGDDQRAGYYAMKKQASE
ncbi:hypothetical protein HI914_02354 [Erysiphe necator]|nr:hypothetical protein HI914_02354 [Erysiphe necator]